MFIAALFTIAKTWKQPKCPPMDEWIKRMRYICMNTIEYYSAIEKREPFAHCSWECKFMQPLWKTTWRFLKKIKKSTTI